MAREESDREDLMREATALVERAELSVTGLTETVVVGFRRDGSPSFFFGGDPVYQFNARCELRRAYVDGLLYKAIRGRLVSLRRHRTPEETELLRHELDPEETIRFRENVKRHLDVLAGAIRSKDCRILAQVPAAVDVVFRVCGILADLSELRMAASPRVG